MLHDLALFKGLLPLPVDHSLKLNDVAPSLQSRYRTFLTTTRDSAPAPRFGTLTLTGRPLESLPWHRCAGSHVPHKSLNRVHAAFVPDAAWAVNRWPSTLCFGCRSVLGDRSTLSQCVSPIHRPCTTDPSHRRG